MTKYIIKNCGNRFFCECKNVRNEDCFLKKIVDICKDKLNLVNYKTYFKRNNYSLKQEAIRGFQDILDLFEIEECE